MRMRSRNFWRNWIRIKSNLMRWRNHMRRRTTRCRQRPTRRQWLRKLSRRRYPPLLAKSWSKGWMTFLTSLSKRGGKWRHQTATLRESRCLNSEKPLTNQYQWPMRVLSKVLTSHKASPSHYWWPPRSMRSKFWTAIQVLYRKLFQSIRRSRLQSMPRTVIQLQF